MVRAYLAACLLSVLAVNTAHAGKVFGEWSVDLTNDRAYLFAATANDSGAVFGQYCQLEESTCYWVLGIATSCERGNSYPVLANTQGSAAPLTVICDGQLSSGLYRYVFKPFDTVDGLLLNMPRIGFAFPLTGDQFRVVRFSLDGAHRAVNTLRQQVLQQPAPPSPSKPSTKDQLM